MANQPTKYKKFLAGAASATLVATAIVPTALAAEVENAATDFSDVAATHTHYAAIMQAVERELFDGYTDGTFKPENSIDRKGVVKSLAKYVIAQSEYKTFEEYITANKLADKVTPFTDVPATHGDAELFNASLIVKDSGIFTGSNNNLMPTNVITRQQMAKVLVNGFGLKDLAGVESEVTDTDKAQAEYVNFINILSENKVTEVTTFNPTGAVKRGQMASFLNRAFDAAHTVVAPETATKVVSVSATNLKEIVVAFDGSVDAATAENEENYTTDAGAVKSAALAEDGKTVTLTLDAGVVMTNQKAYKVSVSKVKAGDKVVTATDFAFTPLDNTLPEVVEVVTLGNKAVKVIMSEPVKNVKTTNFQLDGKSFYGSVSFGGSERELILKPYDASSLTNGEHKLVVSLVEDFYNLKSLSKEVTFTVVEDKEGPTVTEAKATLETATLTFNEDLDADTVKAGDVYWLSGTTKKYATNLVKHAGNKYSFEFGVNDRLPAYETTLYIDSVSDYSGNVNATKDVKVTAVVDQVRPEVTDVKTNSDKKSVTVKFSKSVTATTSNFVITDKDGKNVAIKSASVDSTGKVATVVLYNEIAENNAHTIKVTGVQDTTTLKNTMLDYTTTFNLDDETGPVISQADVSANSAERTVILTFNEKMDLASISNPASYLINFNGSLRSLPADTEIRPVQDGKGVLLTFPEKIGTEFVTFKTATGAAGTLTALQVNGVKDVAGNILRPYSFSANLVTAVADATVTRYSTSVAKPAVFTDGKTLKVRFNQPIGTAKASDFVLTGGTIESVSTDGTNLVTIKLASDAGTSAAALSLKVATGNVIKTVTGNNVTATAAGQFVAIEDQVNPTVKLAANVNTLSSSVNGGGDVVIELPMSESLDATNGSSFGSDLVVTKLSANGTTGILRPGTDYTTAVKADVVAGGVTIDNSHIIEVTVKNAIAGGNDTAYSVEVKNARYIEDKNANTADNSSVYTTGATTDLRNPVASVTSTTVKAGTTVNVQGDEAGIAYLVLDSANITTTTAAELAVTGGTATKVAINANTSTAISTTGLADGAYKVVVADAVGNLSSESTGTVTIDNTATTAVVLGTGTPVTIAAGTTDAITFSESISATDKAAVEAALNANSTDDGTYAWTLNDTVLTITGAATTGTVYTGTDVVVTITDAVGNVATNLLIVDAN